MPVKIHGLKGSAMFIHLPKTGGTTVTKWIWEHHRENLMRLNGHKLGHIPTRYVEHPFKFGFIREPLGWWESVFKFLKYMNPKEMRSKGFQPLAIVQPLMEDDFNAFIENVINRIPGFYCEMLEMYCPELDFVGRTSHLETDFMTVLDLIGFRYDHASVLQWRHWGVRSQSLTWEKGNRQLITDYEQGWERWIKLS